MFRNILILWTWSRGFSKGWRTICRFSNSVLRKCQSKVDCLNRNSFYSSAKAHLQQYDSTKLFAYLSSCYCSSHLQGCVYASEVCSLPYCSVLSIYKYLLTPFLKFIATVFALCNVVENFNVLRLYIYVCLSFTQGLISQKVFLFYVSFSETL